MDTPEPSSRVALTRRSSKQLVAFAAVGVVTLAVGYAAYSRLSGFLSILMLAWLLSIAMEPMVLWLVSKGMARGLAAGLVLLLAALLTGGLTVLFGQVFYAQVLDLGSALPGATRSAVEWVNSTFDTTFDANKVYDNIKITPDTVGGLAQRYGGGVLGAFGTALTLLFDGVTILVFAFFLSADSVKLRQTIGSFLPPRHQPILTVVWRIAVEKTGGYVVSKLVLALLSAFAHCVFFWLIDVPYWLPLGVFAGITAQFIPIIGTYIGVALPALFAILDKPTNVVWIVLFATVYQQIESYVFTPMVSRRTMDVHPAIALAAVFVGVGLFGPVGALIGIPVVAAVITIVDTFRRRHELLPELDALDDDSSEQEEIEAMDKALERAGRTEPSRKDED